MIIFIKHNEIKTIHCVSIGSLFAFLICLNLNLDQLEEYIVKVKDQRIPDLTESGKIQKSIARAITTNDAALFYDQLDLLMHSLKWCPSSLNEVGTTLCFLLPQIQNDLQK